MYRIKFWDYPVTAIEGVEVWQSEIAPWEDKALTMQKAWSLYFSYCFEHKELSLIKARYVMSDLPKKIKWCA